jgi:hypothetical protein
MEPKLLISKSGDQGRGVALLHKVLRALGLSIEDIEIQEKRYGDSTTRVCKFQNSGLPDTGTDLTPRPADRATLPMLRMIHGQVRHADGTFLSRLRPCLGPRFSPQDVTDAPKAARRGSTSCSPFRICGKEFADLLLHWWKGRSIVQRSPCAKRQARQAID